MTELDAWQGDFGTNYTGRNVIEWRTRQPGLRQVLDGLEVKSVLEVGCNRGHNLVALADLLGDEADVVGIEPNRYAQRVARTASDRIAVLNGHAFDLPFKDGSVDLVFTAGVLIHIALERLPAALAEIHRVSRRYVAALEYFAEEETPIPYRGRNDLLWKRNFLKHYQEQYPALEVVKTGYFDMDQGFDRTHWWVLKKP